MPRIRVNNHFKPFRSLGQSRVKRDIGEPLCMFNSLSLVQKECNKGSDLNPLNPHESCMTII